MSSGNGDVSDVSWELMVRGTRCYRGEYAGYKRCPCPPIQSIFNALGGSKTQTIAFHYLEENYL